MEEKPEGKKDYLITPNTDDYGGMALNRLEAGLIELVEMGSIGGQDYHIFPTGDVSLKADKAILEGLIEAGLITGYKAANEVKALDYLISQEPS